MPHLAKQTARYGRKREEILDAAAPLFNARGLSGASMADVAGAVGLTPTSITYYFRKREDLAAACVHRALATMNAMLAEAEATAETPAGRLQAFVRLYFQRLQAIAEKRSPAMINFWDLRAMTGEQGKAAVEAFVALFRRFRQLFADPAFSRAERNARAHLLFSAVLYSKEWVRRYAADDYPRAAERFCEVLTDGLATAASAWAPPRLPPPEEPGAGGEAAREAFLRAATELVNEQGYRGASVDRISAKLSVTKGSFYHHHETKADLIAQCFERSFEVTRQAHRTAAVAPGDGWTRICALASLLVGYQLSPRGPLLRYSALAAVPEAMRPRLLSDFARQSERLSGMVADAVADGSVRPVDPAVAGQFLAGMINAAAELAKWSPAVSEETAADLFVRPALLGLFRSGAWRPGDSPARTPAAVPAGPPR
jgi:AcrR family transcriptional regulator